MSGEFLINSRLGKTNKFVLKAKQAKISPFYNVERDCLPKNNVEQDYMCTEQSLDTGCKNSNYKNSDTFYREWKQIVFPQFYTLVNEFYFKWHFPSLLE